MILDLEQGTYIVRNEEEDRIENVIGKQNKNKIEKYSYHIT